MMFGIKKSVLLVAVMTFLTFWRHENGATTTSKDHAKEIAEHQQSKSNFRIEVDKLADLQNQQSEQVGSGKVDKQSYE